MTRATPNNDNFDQLLSFLVQRLPQIRGQAVGEDDLHRLAFDLLPVAVRVQDEQGLTRACNRAFCHLVGYERDELLGLGPERYVPPGSDKQLALARRTMRAELEKHQRATVQVELTRADGRRFNVVMIARPIRVGDEILVLGVYWPLDALTTALASPKILSSSDTESGSTAS